MPTATGLDAIATHPDLVALLGRCDFHEVTKEDRPDDWLDLRRTGLGGSDTGSLLGLSPYRSPVKLWLQKTGQIPDDDLSDKEAVYWGERLEDIVADEFSRRTGYLVVNPRGTFVNKANPVIIANPDRLYIDDQDRLGVLECKTGDWRTSDHWDEDASPPWYEAQDGHYVGGLGLDRSRIAALLGGNDFQIRNPDIDATFAQSIIDTEVAWWNRHVIGGIAPQIDHMKETTKALNAMWEIVSGQLPIDDLTVDVHDGTTLPVIDVLRAFLDERAAVKAAEERRDRLGNLLRYTLADRESATYRGIPVYTNKVIPTEKIDWKAAAIDGAARLGVDVGELIGAERRTHSSYRRLNPLTNKAAKAAINTGATP